MKETENHQMPQSLYVIQASTGPIKIGIAEDPVARLSGMQVSNPYGLVLCGFVPVSDARKREAEVHAALRGHNLSGEWFRNAPEVCHSCAELLKYGTALVPPSPREASIEVHVRALLAIEERLRSLLDATRLTPPTIPDGVAILRKPQVEKITGRSYSSLRRDIAQGAFPSPLQLGPRAVGWRADEVRAWVNERYSGALPAPKCASREPSKHTRGAPETAKAPGAPA